MSDKELQKNNNTEERKKMSKTKKIVISLIIFIVLAITSFIIYEVATVNNTYYIGEKNLQIPVFVYHDIVADESEVVYEYAYEIAKKYNIPMTSFVIDDCVGAEGYYTWEQAKEMHDNGIMSIYSHGLTHARYNEKTEEELVQETESAYANLTEKLEDENLLKVFTYPYGLYTYEQRVALEEAGYVQNLTDNRINLSNKLELSGLHRDYPLDDSVFKIILKIQYRAIRYQ